MGFLPYCFHSTSNFRMLVGCVGTHAATGAWSLIAAGLFIRKDGLLDALFMSNVQNGLFYVSIEL